MNLEDVKKVQKDKGLGDVHLVYLDHDEFHMAHTDAERAKADSPETAFTLEQCGLGVALAESGGPEELGVEPGLYVIRHASEAHDGVSESFRSDAMNFGLELIEP